MSTTIMNSVTTIPTMQYKMIMARLFPFGVLVELEVGEADGVG